jgi:hypothetical protein
MLLMFVYHYPDDFLFFNFVMSFTISDNEIGSRLTSMTVDILSRILMSK